MADVSPFKALRYAERDLSPLVAPPYDVISPAEQKALSERAPHNIIHLTLGLEEDGDNDTDNKYTRAGSDLRKWIEQGVLVSEPEPAMFLYRTDHEGTGASTAGVICSLSLEQLGEGSVLPHENTMPGPKQDRLSLMRTTMANLEALWFVADRSLGPLEVWCSEASSTEALADVRWGEVRHRAWLLPEAAQSELRTNLDPARLVIADGHHRYETAVVYRDEMRAEHGEGPWDRTLALIQDPSVMVPDLEPIHRAVYGLTHATLEKELDVKEVPDDTSESLDAMAKLVSTAGPGTIGVISEEGAGVVETGADLDTAFLQEKLIEPLDAEVSFIHDPTQLQPAMFEGATIFLMAPIDVAKVVELAASGIKTPPKTTLFWPKPLSGVLMRDLSS